jgi:aminopeptidase N
MDWWSELWLNEGFATWVGWFAIDYLYPGKSLGKPTRSETDMKQIGMSGDSSLYVQEHEVPLL